MEAWLKPLAGGQSALALFNCGSRPAKLNVPLRSLGLKGKLSGRDLWLHRELGSLGKELKVEVPRHGAILLRVGEEHP